MSLLKRVKNHAEASKKLEKLLELAVSSPQVMDAFVELAEKCAADAVLQKILDDTKTRDIDAGFLRKLVESASQGIVIDLQMADSRITLRKEDVYDDMARQRFQKLLQEKAGVQTPFVMPQELTL